MSAFDLTAEIAQQPRGVTIQLDYGEFRGPWVLDRPVRLQGRGPATVLWSPHGPVLTVESSDVHLADLAIETTEEVDGLALLVEAGAHPVGFSKVRIGGRAEGLHPGRRWWVPAVIELGRIQPTQRIERTVICDIPEPASIRVELDGLQVTATEQAGGRLALRLVLDTGGLSAGSAIEGQVHVEAGGLSGIIRVAGSTMVDAGAGAAPVPLLQRLSRDHAPARDATLTGLPRSVVTSGPAVTPDVDASQGPAGSTRPAAYADEHAEMARAYEQAGEVERARGEWGAVLALDPHYPSAREHLTRCFNKLGRFDDAIRIAERALAVIDPAPGAGLYRAVAIAYQRVGRLHEARWALDRSQEISFDPKINALRKAWFGPHPDGGTE